MVTGLFQPHRASAGCRCEHDKELRILHGRSGLESAGLGYNIQSPQGTGSTMARLNRAHPLARGCVFAAMEGDIRGSGFINFNSSQEQVGFCRGNAFPAASTALGRGLQRTRTGTSYEGFGYGTGLRCAGSNWMRWLYNSAGHPELSPTSFGTVFVALKKLTAVCNTVQQAFGRFDAMDPTGLSPGFGICTTDPLGIFPPGLWCIRSCLGFGFNAEVSNAATCAQVVGQETTLCAIFGNFGSQLWIDGRLAANDPFSGPPTTLTTNFYSHNTTSVDPSLDSLINVCLWWNRALPPSAIAQLHSDPFTLWRHKPSPVMFNFMEPAAQRRRDDSCCC